MAERILFYRRKEEAVIVRWYGKESWLVIPDVLGALPVTELADHCFAPEMSVKAANEPLEMAVLEEGSWRIQAVRTEMDPREAVCGMKLISVRLPAYLKSVGSYTFYACDHLQKVVFPAAFSQLGGGAFIGCNHIQVLGFEMKQEYSRPEESGFPDCFREIISDIPYEVEAQLLVCPRQPEKPQKEEMEQREADWPLQAYPGREGPMGEGPMREETPGADVVRDDGEKVVARFLFPEYYEDSKENTPARIISVVFEGTGYRYRQCFAGREFQIRQYDGTFPVCAVQELQETVIPLAMMRLEKPWQLEQEAKEQYLSYLREHGQGTAGHILRENSLSGLLVLCREAYFTEKLLTEFMDLARQRQLAEAVAILMEYRRTHFERQIRKPSERYTWD